MDIQTSSPSRPLPSVKISFLIPVFNEIRTIRTLLRSVQEAPLPGAREIIVVDDCSTDGSREFLVEFARGHPEVVLVLHERNQGKGAAIRSAIERITGDWAVIQDADLEYNPKDIQLLMVPALEGIADVVVGSRFLTGQYRRAMLFWHTLANGFLTTLTNVLCDLNLTDMETCYKLVRADILKSLNLRSRGFDFEPEIIVKLARWGARIYEVAISYRGRTYAEGKKIGAKDALQAIGALLKYRFFDPRYCRPEEFLVLQAVYRAKRFHAWLFSQFAPYLGQEVLEAGSGIGNLTELALSRPRLLSLDQNPAYVKRLHQRFGHLDNFSVRQADLRQRDAVMAAIENQPFDSVFCVNVLEHVENDTEVLRNFNAVLKPGGYAAVVVPCDPSLYSDLDRHLGHHRRYTPADLQRKMTEAGLSVVQCRGFNRTGGLAWRISGKILRKKTLTAGQMTLFELAMPLIRLLEPIPFHSPNSLIAIGRKPA
jgi:glycosyltransferase involved in cell wall biosynthesis